MPLFRDFVEGQRVVMALLPMFPEEGQLTLVNTMSLCLEEEDDMGRRYLLNRALFDALWEIPEAVDIGFKDWLDIKVPIIIEALEYHDNNCKNGCNICQYEIRNI